MRPATFQRYHTMGGSFIFRQTIASPVTSVLSVRRGSLTPQLD